jgi:hypothetical protein
MKRSYRAMALALLVSLPLFFTSCLYRNVRAPGPTNQVTQYNFDTDDFEILGTVESTGKYKTWVWLVSTGGNSYIDLMDKARAMGGDDIIHYRVNVVDYGLLFIIYNSFTYHATATVIKYKPDVLREGRFRRQVEIPERLRPDEDEDEDDDKLEKKDSKKSKSSESTPPTQSTEPTEPIVSKPNPTKTEESGQ